VFVNFTNHNSLKWSAEQRAAAAVYGDIRDMPFPAVDPQASHGDVQALAASCAAEIMALHPDAVLCQGEFTLAFAVVAILKAHGVRVVAACSKRAVRETYEDGATKKIAEYRFDSFREF